jgi:transaldolase
MPENTLRAFREHGRVRRTLDLGVDEAQRVLERFAKAGVDYDDVTQTLEREGVRGFEKSFDELLAGIEERNAA